MNTERTQRGHRLISALARPRQAVCTIAFFLAAGSLSAGERPARPALPATWDQATFQKELHDVEQGHHAAMLKVGYFMRQGSPSLPVRQGYQGLMDALSQEPVGSDRWFTLEQIRAFAGFHCAEIPLSEGYAAYQEVFSHADAAHGEISRYELSTALSDFVSAVSGKLKDLHASDSPATRSLLDEAWAVYTASWRTGQAGGQTDPDWGSAIAASGQTTHFQGIVEGALSKNQARTMGAMRAAVTLFETSDPARALAVLKASTMALTPHTADQAWYYGKVIALSSKTGDSAGALAAARTLVEKTGCGYDRLLPLAAAAHDQAAIDKGLSTLSKEDADEGEILSTAEALKDLGGKSTGNASSALDSVIRLLDSYLTGRRERRLPLSLHARLLLAGALRKSHRLEEAIRTADLPDVPTDVLDQESAFYYRQLRGLKTALVSEQATSSLHHGKTEHP